MILHYLKNLTSHEVTKLDAPPKGLCYPDSVKTKEQHTSWCRSSHTDHIFYSALEGETPGLRCAKANEPRWVHGLIAEFDAKPVGDLQARIRQISTERKTFGPRWLHYSFSGHFRLVYEFTRPMPFHSLSFYKKFVEIASRELKLDLYGDQFKIEETNDPYHYFDAGGSEWIELYGPLPEHNVNGWLIRAGEKHSWKGEGPRLPLDKIREEGRRVFADTGVDWDHIEFGDKCTLFWLNDGGRGLDGQFLDNGVHCYSPRAGKLFCTWADIFGNDFVRQTRDKTMGAVIADCWYEGGKGKCYWWRVEGQKRIISSVANLRTELIQRGVAPEDTDKALLNIEKFSYVDGTCEAHFNENDIIMENRGRKLNVSTAKLLQPAEGRFKYGENFEWIGNHWLKPMLGEEQFPYYMAWLAYFYQSCLAGRPKRGLALYLAGNAGTGKTLSSSVLLGGIFGGARGASEFLTGQDQFSGELFKSAIWMVDDPKGVDSPRIRNHLAQSVKAIVANDMKVRRAMHREGDDTNWLGRIVVTLNLDGTSTYLFPDMDSSMSDKIMLLKALGENLGTVDEDRIKAELPYFCAWLRDLDIPSEFPEAWVGGRFGTKPYVHPELMEIAETHQPSVSLSEIIDIWRTQYFRANPEIEAWRGNPTAMLKDLLLCEETRDLVRQYSGNLTRLGRDLMDVARKDRTGRITSPRGNRRLYTITK